MYSTRAYPILTLPKALGVTALLLMTACTTNNGLDWDLRAGQGSLDTSEGLRQPTAARPAADGRGIISYPGYQLALAQRGDTVAAVAQRLGLDAEALARTNALRPGDPLRDGEMLLLPTRVAGGAVAGNVIGGASGGVDVSAIATSALDRAGTPGTAPTPPLAAGPEPIRHIVARGFSPRAGGLERPGRRSGGARGPAPDDPADHRPRAGRAGCNRPRHGIANARTALGNRTPAG
ncbi:MAG: hypothetical protein V4516_16150 [Pseudomonadota bacterium]